MGVLDFSLFLRFEVGFSVFGDGEEEMSFFFFFIQREMEMGV